MKIDSDADCLLITMLEILQNQHKNMTNKFNHDIFMINFADSEKCVYEQKTILESEKLLHK